MALSKLTESYCTRQHLRHDRVSFRCEFELSRCLYELKPNYHLVSSA
jgi:hypothetical protein